MNTVKYYVRVSHRTNDTVCSMYPYTSTGDSDLPTRNHWYAYHLVHVPTSIPRAERRKYCELQMLILNT